MELALFDFDGTITHSNTFAKFIKQAVAGKRRIFGPLLFAPLVMGYKLGLVSGTALRTSLVRFTFSGRKTAPVEALGVEFSQDVLPLELREYAMERIAWHKASGHTVVVVSASLDVYLSHWCTLNGVDLICPVLESVAGTYTGRYADGDCFGRRKAELVSKKYDLSSFTTVYAYGDTQEDEAMLGLAHKRFYQWRER